MMTIGVQDDNDDVGGIDDENVVGYVIFMPQDILQNRYLTLGTVGVISHWCQKDPTRLKRMVLSKSNRGHTAPLRLLR